MSESEKKSLFEAGGYINPDDSSGINGGNEFTGSDVLCADDLNKIVKNQMHLKQTKADLASPALTGSPTAPTAHPTVNNTQIATTAFVQTGLSTKAPLLSPVFAGTATVPAITGLTSINGVRLRMDTLYDSGFVLINNAATTVKSMGDYDFLLFTGMMYDGMSMVHNSVLLPTGVETEYCIFFRTTTDAEPQHLRLALQDNHTVVVRPTPYSSSVMVYLKYVHGFKISI